MSFYKLNFELLNKHNEHNFTLEDIENMIPWERDIYVGLTEKYLTDKQKALENGGNG